MGRPLVSSRRRAARRLSTSGSRRNKQGVAIRPDPARYSPADSWDGRTGNQATDSVNLERRTTIRQSGAAKRAPAGPAGQPRFGPSSRGRIIWPSRGRLEPSRSHWTARGDYLAGSSDGTEPYPLRADGCESSRKLGQFSSASERSPSGPTAGPLSQTRDERSPQVRLMRLSFGIAIVILDPDRGPSPLLLRPAAGTAPSSGTIIATTDVAPRVEERSPA